ncbi:sce7725 family protein [Wohlfahrtiimonas chitiniclastica]|uniref:sce7725 family protein n=1 Tax=Wohlfahrtiimonas chitiniclastica TaxID=400946 RepID=UPI000B98B471|nr:sce7725 family protein [Wohlfahrtiimonas chitiniclastica]MBS7815942.1 sce7725 family protein [Wohlfahrtiimonas chitiniclastica]MBS7822063.1 sce7725 family protein [Wohlfahrtiimonas chitiniclastica]MBS7829855.1 sce7725 family protein [Wohlfahrtiimonas chitiniclastica]MBS7831822.1 sce7725 family protein [Wohlfahrtiimonas chitiniclastica]OYQ69093.1 hypothetical protein B9T13_09840 [Wohlfahrtiimonas chitiniclastica]
MYYPYLRARQFELIALRELVQANAIQSNIMPVLEPVKNTFNSLNLAHSIFVENGMKVFLVTNPICGEIKDDADSILEYIYNGDAAKNNYIPAFHYQDNFEYIQEKINQFNIKSCLIIGLGNFTDENGLKKILEANEAVTHIMLADPHKYRVLDRYIKRTSKKYIKLDDLFEKQERNADFLDILEHKYTEEHLYYKDEGYHGIADFTLMPSEFIDGGSTPRAVVIHLTYIKKGANNEVWIRHFTSDTNDSIANVQGKFGEAAKKAITFIKSEGLKNLALDELDSYYTEGRYPGLGIVKKISIKNHLLVMNDAVAE